jgi:hypothetical protein
MPFLSFSQEIHSVSYDETNPPCILGSILSKSVVRYTSHATIEFQISNPEKFNSNVFVLLGKDESQLKAIQNNGIITFENVPLDHKYSLTASTECMGIVSLMDVHTSKPENEPIQLRKEFFDAITKYGSNETQNVKLFDFLKELEGVTLIEKNYFIQKYWYKDNLIPASNVNSLLGSNISEILGDTIRDRDVCFCEYMYVFSQLLSPVTLVQVGNNRRYTYVQNISQIDKHTTFLQQSQGPARRYNFIYNDNCVAESRSIKAMDVSSMSSTNEASMSAYLFCTKWRFELPEECICERILIVPVIYDSRLLVKSDQFFNVVCGWNGSSHASAEDLLLVTRTSTNSSNQSYTKSLLGMKRMQASTSCGNQLNAGFFSSAVDLAGSLLPFYLNSIDTIKNNGLNLTPAQLQALKDNLIKLINTSTVLHSGTCNPIDTTGKFEDTYFIKIKPNVLEEIKLVGYHSFHNGGSSSFETSGFLFSDFSMAMVELGGQVRKSDDTYCCTDFGMQWMYAAFEFMQVPLPFRLYNSPDGIVATGQKLFKRIRTYPPSIPSRKRLEDEFLGNQYGTFIETIPNCRSIDFIGGRIINTIKFEAIPFVSNIYSIKNTDNLDNTHIYKCTVYDLLGRIIEDVKLNGNIYDANKLKDNNIYMIKITDENNNSITQKIYKYE